VPVGDKRSVRAAIVIELIEKARRMTERNIVAIHRDFANAQLQAVYQFNHLFPQIVVHNT
jgi:hypothetical protein